jgi:hypothetical protein
LIFPERRKLGHENLGNQTHCCVDVDADVLRTAHWLRGPDLPTLSLRGIAAPWVTSPDPRLTGTWVAEEGELCSQSAPCRFQFSKEGEGRVKLIFDAANKDLGCAGFDVTTAHIGSTEYLDLKLDSFCGPGGKDRDDEVLDSIGGFAAMHILPLHSIWKVGFSDKSLIWTAIATPASAELNDTEWFQDSPTVFVGTSDALATWLQRFGEQAENKPYFVAHRTDDGSPPATGEQPGTSRVNRSLSTNLEPASDRQQAVRR